MGSSVKGEAATAEKYVVCVQVTTSSKHHRPFPTLGISSRTLMLLKARGPVPDIKQHDVCMGPTHSTHHTLSGPRMMSTRCQQSIYCVVLGKMAAESLSWFGTDMIFERPVLTCGQWNLWMWNLEIQRAHWALLFQKGRNCWKKVKSLEPRLHR